jgi:hypothetical protein
MNFAVRRRNKSMALVCDCGRETTGKGVTRWRFCPRCGARVISSKQQRQRESYSYSYHLTDEQINQQLSEAVEEPKPAEQPKSEVNK